MLPVKRFGGIEQVSFYGRPIVAECRTRAEVHHSAKAASRRLHSNGVNAFRRKQLPLWGSAKIHRRKAERAAAALPLNHRSAYGIRAAERLLGALEIAAGDRPPDGRR